MVFLNLMLGQRTHFFRRCRQMYFHERIFEAADAIVTPMTGCARATDHHHCSSFAVVIRSY